MFQSVLVRAISFLIFAPAVYLTYFLIEEFTVGQSTVIAGLAMISLLVSAIALLVARYSFRRGDPITGWSSLVMYGLAAIVMIFLELGFWNSSILSSHASLQRADAARDGMDMLAERERQAIRAGALAESSAEIVAKMDAQLAQPIGNQPLAMLTSNCTDKQSKVYRLCGEYLDLKAAHAKAEAREKAEGRIWNAGTRVEQSGLKKDIFSGATAAAGLLGGKPEVWAGIFSVVMMLLLMATRDLSALGAFGPGVTMREKVAESAQEVFPDAGKNPTAEPRTTQGIVEMMRETGLEEYTGFDPKTGLWTHVKQKPKAEEPATPPAKPASEPQEAPERERSSRLGDRLDDIRDRLHAAPEPSVAPAKPTPPPTDGGTRAPDPVRETVVPIRRSVAELPSFASDMFEESEPPTKRSRVSRKLPPGRAIFWLSDCTERTNDLSVTCTEEAAWSHYLAWCDAEEFKPIGRGKFLRTIEARIGMAPNGRGFIGLVLCSLGVGEEKMRAFA
jgi:hypothetical protein